MGMGYMIRIKSVTMLQMPGSLVLAVCSCDIIIIIFGGGVLTRYVYLALCGFAARLSDIELVQFNH